MGRAKALGTGENKHGVGRQRKCQRTGPVNGLVQKTDQNKSAEGIAAAKLDSVARRHKLGLRTTSTRAMDTARLKIILNP